MGQHRAKQPSNTHVCPVTPPVTEPVTVCIHFVCARLHYVLYGEHNLAYQECLGVYG